MLKLLTTVCCSFSSNCIIHTSTWFSQSVALNTWGLSLTTAICNNSSKLFVCIPGTEGLFSVLPSPASQCYCGHIHSSQYHIMTLNVILLTWARAHAQSNELQRIIQVHAWDLHLCMHHQESQLLCCHYHCINNLKHRHPRPIWTHTEDSYSCLHCTTMSRDYSYFDSTLACTN